MVATDASKLKIDQQPMAISLHRFSDVGKRVLAVLSTQQELFFSDPILIQSAPLARGVDYYFQRVCLAGLVILEQCVDFNNSLV